MKIHDINKTTKTTPKTITATVVSSKMDKTIKVHVSYKVKHLVLGKFISRTTVYYAHDEYNRAREGDLVRLIPSRPLSKTKRWIMQDIIEKKGTAYDLS